MTSKEALKKLVDEHIDAYYVEEEQKEEIIDLVDKINKDLELLEIFKEWLEIKKKNI